MKMGNFFDHYIAVIIPVYNNADRLHHTLNALEGQFFKNFITIIIDDNSDARVKQVCLQHKDAIDIYYIRNKENLGVAQSRQKGMEFVLSTKIPYFMFLDADDILVPSALQRFYLGIFYSKEDVCIGDKVNLYEYAPSQNHFYYKTENTVWITNKLFKSDFIKKNKLFIKDFHFHEDLYFNLRVLNCLPNIKYLNNVTYMQINHKQSYTETAVNHFSKQSMEYTMLEAVYNAILDSNTFHVMTIEYFLASYRDYQLCKKRKIDLTEIDKLLVKISNVLDLEKISEETWSHCAPVLASMVVVDENFSDYDDPVQYLCFEENFFQWAKRFNLIKNFVFPIQNQNFFLDKKYVDTSEVELYY